MISLNFHKGGSELLYQFECDMNLDYYTWIDYKIEVAVSLNTIVYIIVQPYS